MNLADELLSMGGAVVVVKMGAQGLVACWADPRSERFTDTGALRLGERLPEGDGRSAVVPAFPVERVVSATGAGDTAIAGVLAGLLAGVDLLSSCEIGCMAGRNAVMTVDSVSSVVPLAVIRSQIENWREENDARGTAN